METGRVDEGVGTGGAGWGGHVYLWGPGLKRWLALGVSSYGLLCFPDVAADSLALPPA